MIVEYEEASRRRKETQSFLLGVLSLGILVNLAASVGPDWLRWGAYALGVVTLFVLVVWVFSLGREYREWRR